MKVNILGFWKHITITAISLVLLLAMMLMFGSTISNQANRVSDSPVYYRVSMDCN